MTACLNKYIKRVLLGTTVSGLLLSNETKHAIKLLEIKTLLLHLGYP